MDQNDRQPSLFKRQFSRRAALRRGGLTVAGIASAALIGCSSGGSSGGNGAPAGASSTAAGASGAKTQRARGGTLKVGIGTETNNIDPHFGGNSTDHRFFYMAHDNLVAYGPNGLADPARSLAESWEMPDPKTIRFKIRSGVTIADSDEPVDAALIAWNLERARSTTATAAIDLTSVDKIEAPSATELLLRLKEPNGSLITALGDRAGSVVSRRKVDELGKEKFARAPLGSGLFKLVEWRQGDVLRYQKNAKHWRKDSLGGAMPYVDAIEVKIIPDDTVRIAALEAGEIHTTTPVPPQDYKRLKGNPAIVMADFVGASAGRFNFNTTVAPLNNEWFRLALAHALDREAYKKNFLLGHEPVMSGLLTPANWAFDPKLPAPTFDPKKVQEYLQRSGLPQDQWKITSQPHSGPKVSDAELFWQASVAPFGIKIEFAQNGLTSGFTKKVNKNLGGDGTVNMYIGGWSMRVDPDASLSQHLDQKGGYNAGAAEYPEVGSLLVKARQSVVVEERKKLYSEIEKLALNHVYGYIGTGYTIAVDAAQKRVGGTETLFGGEGKQRWAELWLNA